MLRRLVSSSFSLSRLSFLSVPSRTFAKPLTEDDFHISWALCGLSPTDLDGMGCDCSCWNCDHEHNDLAYFCSECDKIQDPCVFLNYFSLFGLTPDKFEVDVERLHKKYLRLQRRLHPDKFVTSEDTEQEFAERTTERLNTAYKTLSNPELRARYLLQLEGLEIGMPDPAFLMGVMELMEKVESGEVEDPEEIKADMQARILKEGEVFNELYPSDREASAQSAAKMVYYGRIANLCDEVY